MDVTGLILFNLPLFVPRMTNFSNEETLLNEVSKIANVLQDGCSDEDDKFYTGVTL